MKKRIICICMAALLSLSLLAGCGAEGNTDTEQDAAAQTVTVRLSEVTHSVFYAPQYVAMSQGFFADEGLDIDLSNGGGADKVMTAVVSGGADIGLAGPESCIYIHGQGKDDLPVIFAQLTKRDGSFLVGRTDEDFDWSNLKGKTIIGGRKGGVPEMTLEYVLRRHGLEPQVDVIVDTSVQFNMMAGAFVGGVFLACGTLSDPETKYHLEFAVPRPEVLMMFVDLLQGVGFQPLLTQRRGQTIVYLHDSTQIEDLLTFMGCPLTSMEIMNAKIIKERRNAANRASNCDTANMDKVAGAAAQQIAAIRAVGLESLPEELRALARLRLENPFDSLRELGEKLSPPLSRSGVNHRLEKIQELASRKD